jgi:hypothetical protein
MRPHKLLAVVLFSAALLSFVGSFALGMGSGCVAPSGCDFSPPGGMYCNVVTADDGSNGSGGAAASLLNCAYVAGYEDWGWGCGGACPLDSGC